MENNISKIPKYPLWETSLQPIKILLSLNEKQHFYPTLIYDVLGKQDFGIHGKTAAEYLSTNDK